MDDHYQRVKDLADEARDDSDSGFQSRAAAMTALTTLLVQITKAQESIITMESLTRVEQIVIDTVKDYLTENEMTELLEKLEHNLASL